MLPSLPGVLSDRLFSAFDLDNSGTIDFNEFLEGLHALGENIEKKLAFLHRMYDLNGDGFVSKQELLMMLTHMSHSTDISPLGPKEPAARQHLSPPSRSEQTRFVTYPQTSASSPGTSPRQRNCQDENCIQQIINETLPSDNSTLDFSTFVKLVQEKQELRLLLEAFCQQAMPGLFLFSSDKDNSATAFQILPKAHVAVTELAKQKPALASPLNYCGWLYHKGTCYFAVLKDKYLLLYKSPEDIIPSKAIGLSRATVTSKDHDIESFDDPALDQVVVVDHSYILPPSNDHDFRWNFSLQVAKGQKFKLAAASDHDCLRWIKLIRDVLNGKLAEFHEHYLLRGPLGRGRFSTVFSAQHRASGTKVAVKIMRRIGTCTSPPAANRHLINPMKWLIQTKKRRSTNDHFRTKGSDEMVDVQDLQRKEVSVLKLLNHPNIVKMMDVYHSADFIYIIMPWTPAGDLRTLIDAILVVNRSLRVKGSELRISEGEITISDVECIWIPERVCQELLRSILRGLSYLHSKLRNVVHRDIKPDNILLDFRVDEMINDLTRLFELRKREKALADVKINLPSVFLKIPAEDELRLASHSGGGGGQSTTGVPSGKGSSNCRAALDICTPSYEDLSPQSSEVSSAMDTVDHYPLETPQCQTTVLSNDLLGSLDEDYGLSQVTRSKDHDTEHVNAWLFLHVLLWVFKDHRESDFLMMLSSRNECFSPWFPGNLLEHLSFEDIVTLISKHTHPKITDFGLSTILAPLEPNANPQLPRVPSNCRLSTHAKEPMGTEAYAAPEVKRGNGYTTSADIWSLGVVTYQLLSNGYFPSIDGKPQCPGSPTFSALQCNSEVELKFVPDGLWHGISDEAKVRTKLEYCWQAFVTELLRFDPDSRPTAEKCLCHPWLFQRASG